MEGGRQRLFEAEYDVVTKAETIRIICEAIDSGKKGFQRGDINVASVVQASEDHVYKQALNEADVINIDGVGARWGAMVLGQMTAERVAGVDLFVNLLEIAEKRQYSVFLLGATDRVLADLVERLQRKHPCLRIVGARNGYFWGDVDGVVREIQSKAPDMLFVGIKSPEKEKFLWTYKNELNAGLIMGVGGSFDVLAGHVKRAPIWMQSAGLEWLFRVVQEPKRMWKRYLVSNCKFACMVCLAKIARTLPDVGNERKCR